MFFINSALCALAGSKIPAICFFCPKLEKPMKYPQTKTAKLTYSAAVVAIFIVVMYITQPISFGPIQSRFATALYALPALFPFLVLPLAIANGFSNFMLGSFGLPDVIGGLAIGLITSGAAYLVGRFKFSMLLVIPIIIFLPGFIVPIWLSPLTGVPYLILVLQLCLGQTPPAILGYILLRALSNIKETSQ